MTENNLKVAIVSDIHGYSIAFDRVLADIAHHGVDHLVIAGDLVEGGPDPAGVLQRVRELSVPTIQGNTDYDIAKRHRDSKLAAWTESQIGAEGREFLLNLPFEHRVTPPGADSPWQDLLVVHANPMDFNRAIEPNASVEDLKILIGKTKAAVIAFGHIHIAYIRKLPNMQLLDVSAVGNPKDMDLRSKWGLAEWNTVAKTWTVDLHYVPYPLDETVEQMRDCGMPNVEKHIRKLKRASY